MTDEEQAERFLWRLFRKLTQLFALAEPENEDDWFRAGCDVICPTCGRLYLDHAQDPRDPWLTILCGGQRVKL